MASGGGTVALVDTVKLDVALLRDSRTTSNAANASTQVP